MFARLIHLEKKQFGLQIFFPKNPVGSTLKHFLLSFFLRSHPVDVHSPPPGPRVSG